MPLRDSVRVSGDIGDNKRAIPLCADVRGEHGERATHCHALSQWWGMKTLVWVAIETVVTYSTPAAGSQGLFWVTFAQKWRMVVTTKQFRLKVQWFLIINSFIKYIMLYSESNGLSEVMSHRTKKKNCSHGKQLTALKSDLWTPWVLLNEMIQTSSVEFFFFFQQMSQFLLWNQQHPMKRLLIVLKMLMGKR